MVRDFGTAAAIDGGGLPGKGIWASMRIDIRCRKSTNTCRMIRDLRS